VIKYKNNIAHKELGDIMNTLALALELERNYVSKDDIYVIKDEVIKTIKMQYAGMSEYLKVHPTTVFAANLFYDLGLNVMFKKKKKKQKKVHKDKYEHKAGSDDVGLGSNYGDRVNRRQQNKTFAGHKLKKDNEEEQRSYWW